ncbi:MAG TPA: PqiC family protein, partial [Rhodopila sp.]
MSGRGWGLFVGCLLLAGCSAPPLTLYTLGTPPIASDAAPLGRHPVVIAVSRVTIPDELDTEDMLIRDGNTLRRSQRGRWASRLSLGITDRLTERLAARYPRALVTDRPLTETPSERILVNIGRLDVTTGGVATLDADWMVVPRDAAAPARRQRGHFSATGPVK